MLRGRDVQELKELQRQGMSIQAISKLTGWDRKTIRKYMQAAGLAPEYGPRSAPPSKLDAFKPYLEQRLRAGVWNARVLLRELRERNYTGGYTILTDWLRPQRSATRVVAVRRFETAPGSAQWLGALGRWMVGRTELPASLRWVAGGGGGAALDKAGPSGWVSAFRVGGCRGFSPLRWLGRRRRLAFVLDFARYWGFPPPLRRSFDEGKWSGCEVCAAELSVWLARARRRLASDAVARWIWCGTARADTHALVRWVSAFVLVAGGAPRPSVVVGLASGGWLWIGKAAGIRCPGSMPAKKCGYRKLRGKWISPGPADRCLPSQQLQRAAFPRSGVPLGREGGGRSFLRRAPGGVGSARWRVARGRVGVTSAIERRWDLGLKRWSPAGGPHYSVRRRAPDFLYC